MDNKNQSIEQLENDFWKLPHQEESFLIQRCHELRKVPLEDFEVEDLRLMIGQNIGLSYLVEIALVELERNILVSGDFYEGDLLLSVLSCDSDVWRKDRVLRDKFCEILDANIDIITSYDFSRSVASKLQEKITSFRNI